MCKQFETFAKWYYQFRYSQRTYNNGKYRLYSVIFESISRSNSSKDLKENVTLIEFSFERLPWKDKSPVYNINKIILLFQTKKAVVRWLTNTNVLK